MTLSHIINEDEWKGLPVQNDIFKYILDRLKKCFSSQKHIWQGSNAVEILKGIGNLISLSFDNAKKFADLELPQILEIALLKEDNNEEEKLEIIKCIWKLSYNSNIACNLSGNSALMTGVFIVFPFISR